MSDDSTQEREFESLLEFLKRTRRFDFTGYKRTSLMRRVQKRMLQVQTDSYTEYVDYLQVRPEEFIALFNTILINVTSFFRDEEAWRALERKVLPDIVATGGEDAPIRAWSAGCASGEEACTLAMLLFEQLGLERFRRQVKIYATDVDEDALAVARRAVYTKDAVRAVPESLREKYFESTGDGLQVHSDLRRSIVFGRHDLVQDAPISNLDLLICRNTLMYLNAETQARVIARLHYAVKDGGYVFLGKAETLLTNSTQFEAVNPKLRIFRNSGHSLEREQLGTMMQTGSVGADEEIYSLANLLQSAFQRSVSAQIVVDHRSRLALFNRQAEKCLGLGASDVGRPLHDLRISYQPVELRSLIDRAQADRRMVVADGVEWKHDDGSAENFEVIVMPLTTGPGRSAGTSITFRDCTRENQMRAELDRKNREFEHFNEELRSSNEAFETTNEELQSTNEELETTNEELQSSNEELETINEELQSTNDELRTMNEQLQTRTIELNRSNAYFESILTSFRSAVIAVDRESRVQAWKGAAADFWGLREEEVLGQLLKELDIGLPMHRLEDAITDCLSGRQSEARLQMSTLTRRGKQMHCSLTCVPLRPGQGPIEGVIVVITPVEQQRLQPH